MESNASNTHSLNDVAALVFDIDGTLIDSAGAIIDQFMALFREFGDGSLTKEAVVHLIHDSGGSIHEIFHRMFGELDEAKLQRIFDRRVELSAIAAQVTHPFKGVVESLDTLRGRGYRLALFSTRERWLIEGEPAVRLLLPHFEVVISLEDIDRPKPHPDGIVAALKELDVLPQQAAMIGDTTADIQSARGAGVTAIAVTHGFGGHGELEAARPDYLINNIPELLKLLANKPANVIARPATVLE